MIAELFRIVKVTDVTRDQRERAAYLGKQEADMQMS